MKRAERTLHGLSQTPEYFAWRSMRHRCLSKICKAYPKYGGRGITVCKEWNNFLTFLKDMGRRPKNKTLERIDNNKGYNKKNCIWASHLEQNNNRRSNRELFLYGHRFTLIQVSRKYKINPSLLRDRLNRKWDIRDAILKPTRDHISRS